MALDGGYNKDLHDGELLEPPIPPRVVRLRRVRDPRVVQDRGQGAPQWRAGRAPAAGQLTGAQAASRPRTPRWWKTGLIGGGGGLPSGGGLGGGGLRRTRRSPGRTREGPQPSHSVHGLNTPLRRAVRQPAAAMALHRGVPAPVLVRPGDALHFVSAERNRIPRWASQAIDDGVEAGQIDELLR